MSIDKKELSDIFKGLQCTGEIFAFVQCMTKGESNLIPHSTCYPKYNKPELTQEEKDRGERLRNRWQGFMG